MEVVVASKESEMHMSRSSVLGVAEEEEEEEERFARHVEYVLDDDMVDPFSGVKCE